MKEKYFTIILGFLFAMSYALTGVYKPNSDNHFDLFLFIIGLVIFCSIYYVNNAMRLCSNKSAPAIKINDKLYFFINFFINCAIGILTQLLYFPGVLSNDTAIIILVGKHIAGQHPWIYIAFLKVLKKIVHLLGGTDYALIIIAVIFQIIIISLSYSLCLVWLKRKCVPKFSLILISCFYALCPILNLYKVTLIKDIPFSLGMLLLTPLMYEIWNTNGEILLKNRFLVVLSVCTLLMFMRNNGPIISMLLAIYLLFQYKKYFRRILIYIIFIVTFVISTKIVQTVIKVPYLFREAAGIPIQQIAATVYNNGSVNNEQLELINNILSVDLIMNDYDPYNVDPLKYNEMGVNDEFLNNNKERFIKLWAELLFKNFDIYVDSYLRTTYGFWSFSNDTTNMKYTYIGAFDDPELLSEWINYEKIHEKEILPAYLQKNIEKVFDSISVFLGVGVMAWLVVCIMLTLVKKYGCKFFIVGLPSIICWITLLISTPIAFQWRYGLAFAYILPILYGMVLIPNSKSVK